MLMDAEIIGWNIEESSAKDGSVYREQLLMVSNIDGQYYLAEIVENADGEQLFVLKKFNPNQDEGRFVGGISIRDSK